MKIRVILCCLILAMYLNGNEVMASIYYGDVGAPSPNEVHIGVNCIIMPLGKILLVRRDSEYCAIKFTKFWTGKTEEDLFANYESYNLEIKAGNLNKENIQINKGELSFPKPRGIGRFAFSFGNKEIKCGLIKLFWSGEGAVHFYEEGQHQGDYGIELAPTNWSDISEVNLSDTHLRWYRYDDKRKRKNIKLNELSPHP